MNRRLLLTWLEHGADTMTGVYLVAGLLVGSLAGMSISALTHLNGKRAKYRCQRCYTISAHLVRESIFPTPTIVSMYCPLCRVVTAWSPRGEV